ncbi:cytochrome P450 [Amycolatopsis sp. NBC_01488]|uniref:cytochrome P450 n=1 Tax=Amycolatopsis sp. NBC_01488 TaxID=2903563 RepID=UPI002E290CFC|nr:cytochrome P450 [Amycolatopsis sp. NBC_01488]
MTTRPADAPVVCAARRRLPLLGHTLWLALRRVDYLQALRACGDAVLIHLGPLPVYVLNSPELIHRMLVEHAGKFSKGLLFDRARPYFGDGLLTSSGSFHMRQRRLVQPAFHRDAVYGHTAAMANAVNRHIDQWRDGQVIAVERETRALATSIIVETLFDTDDSMQLAELVERSLPEFIAGVGRRTLLPSALTRLPIPGTRRFDAAGADLRRTTLRFVAQHRRDGGNLVSRLLAARDHTGRGMTDDEAVDEVITLLIAGIETSATTLAWAYHELGHHPQLRDRLHHEVDTVLAGRRVTAADLPRLRFNRALLYEILRLHHPTWLLMRRAQEDADLGGVLIPAGAEALYSPTTLHRDPNLYADPLRLDPDRWLPDPPPLPRCSFIPFGAGNRKCVGETFAWSEMSLILATVAARWQLDPCSGTKVKTIVDGIVRPGHLPMTVRSRAR